MQKMVTVYLRQIDIRKLIREVNPDLVNLRNPRTGQMKITGRMPISSAGPLYRVHWDQYEKMWICGFMCYAGRDRHSAYCPGAHVLRNKKTSSILLSFLSAVYHLRGIPPYQAQFDCGTEAKACQEWMYRYGGAGANSVLTGPCKANQVIELFWNPMHCKCIWIFRIEMAHLQNIWCLNICNTIQLSAMWASYAPAIQGEIDKFVSTYNDHVMLSFYSTYLQQFLSSTAITAIALQQLQQLLQLLQ